MAAMLILFPVLVALLCLTRLTLQADLRRFGQTQGRILVRAGTWQKQWHLAVVRTEQGHQVVLADARNRGAPPKTVSPTAMKGSPAERLMQVLVHSGKARDFLLHHLHLDRLDALLCLRLEDAARCALVSGAMQSATALLPLHWRQQVHLRVMPDFFRDHSTLQMRCILHLRLGTIIVTAAMLLAAYVKQAWGKKEA